MNVEWPETTRVKIIDLNEKMDLAECVVIVKVNAVWPIKISNCTTLQYFEAQDETLPAQFTIWGDTVDRVTQLIKVRLLAH